MLFNEIDEIVVESDGVQRRLILAQGDLARTDPQQGVDLLILSAFPGDYIPTPTSLIGQLHAQGVSVQELSEDKQKDLRHTTGAWLSKPIGKPGFNRIVCFEPQVLGRPPEIVGGLFRALFPFLNDTEDQVLAMPLLSTGDAGWSEEEMAAALLQATTEWMRLGLPVSKLYLVSRSVQQIDALVRAFSQERRRMAQVPPPSSSKPTAAPAAVKSGSSGRFSSVLGAMIMGVAAVWASLLVVSTYQNLSTNLSASDLDVETVVILGFVFLLGLALLISGRRTGSRGPTKSGGARRSQAAGKTRKVFISFSSHDAAAVDFLKDRFKARAPHIELFDFRRDIDLGLSYQREIDNAMKQSDYLLSLLSPDYLASGECLEEFYVARMRNKREAFKFLIPVYWRNVLEDLEDWVMILNLADCREADQTALKKAVDRLVKQIDTA